MSAGLAGDLFGTLLPAFDAAMANPPYRKISTDSAERIALRSVGFETSNLYTGFIALIQRLLVPGGQLVGITPRSFCNGSCFRPFREDFLRLFHAVKGGNQPDQLTPPAAAGSTATARLYAFLSSTVVVTRKAMSPTSKACACAVRPRDAGKRALGER